jgi:NADPH-dependent curcumin reductase
VAPGGVDFLSDGIGGAFTERLVAAMAPGGRLFAYGSAANYYGDAPVSRPASLRAMFGISPAVEQMLALRDIRSEAWIVDAFYHGRLAAEDALSAMLRDGTVKPVHRVVRGFDAVPQAIVDLYRVPHAGKLQVSFE